MPFVLLVIAVLVVSAPVSADYLTDRPVLATGVQIKIEGLMTKIDQLASPNPQVLYPRIKNFLKAKLATMATGDLAYDLVSDVTYQVSARDGIANRTFTPHGIDWFLHDPEDFVVEDVTEDYLNGCYDECTKEDFQKIKENIALIKSIIRSIRYRKQMEYGMIIIDSTYDPNTFLGMSFISRERGSIKLDKNTMTFSPYDKFTDWYANYLKQLGARNTNVRYYEAFYEEGWLSYEGKTQTGSLMIEAPFGLGPNIDDDTFRKRIYQSIDYKKKPH